MKNEDASGIGFLESRISTSERRRGRAEDVVGLRFSRGSSSNSVFTVVLVSNVLISLYYIETAVSNSARESLILLTTFVP